MSSAVWTAGASWGSQLITLAVFVILARYLGPDDFGVATLAMLPPLFLSVLVITGIPDALVQRGEITAAHLDSAFWFLAGLGLMLSALIWAFAGPIAGAFGQSSLKQFVRWTSIIVAIQALAAVPTVVLKRELGFRVLAVRTLAATAFSAALGIGLAIAGFGVWSLVWIQIAKAAVGTALVFLGSGWRPSLRYSHARCRELFGFASPVVAQSLLAMANDELPAVALGVFLGPGAVGVYAFARRPFQILWDVFLNPLMGLVLPTVSRVQNDPERINRFFDAAVRMTALAAFPIFIGFAAVAPSAVPFIFGKQWGSAVLAIQIITPQAVVRTIDALCAYTILALGYSGLVLKLNISFTILAAIPIVFASRISVEAMVAAMVACNLALLPFFLFFAQRIARINIRQPLDVFPRLAVASSLMFAAVTAVRLGAPENTPQIVTIGSAVVIGAIVFGAAAMALVRPDLKAARELLLKMRT
ncbi:MAG: lipopolysaccharide biosynthesis protein [Methylocella sp.]